MSMISSRSRFVGNCPAQNSETYELKIVTFEHGQPEEFLQLMKNFKRAVDGTGNTTAAGKINYLHTLLNGGSLRAFDELASPNAGTKNAHLKFIQEGLLGYFFRLTPLPSRSAWCVVQCVNFETYPSSALPPVSRNLTTTSIFPPDPSPPIICPPKNSTRSSYTPSWTAGEIRPIYKAGTSRWRATKLLVNYLK